MGFFSKLFGRQEKESLYQGLKKTREGFVSKIFNALAGKTKLDEELLNELEEALLGSDVGVETTVRILERIEKKAAGQKFGDEESLRSFIQNEIEQILLNNTQTDFYDFKSE
ncbi:MAG: signal recognition particle-docking protein FtsY, partial [Chitinophagia bacterium]|nr:signal recognition particle-docking protein FtsY [Chitinophagia bacterium]